MKLGNRTYQKVIAFMISAVLFCLITAASVFIVLHAGHDCTGEDCPVCDGIRQAESVFRMTGDGDAGTVTGVVTVCPVVVSTVLLFLPLILLPTLVQQKVQLNN